jgi:hypothetical protein
MFHLANSNYVRSVDYTLKFGWESLVRDVEALPKPVYS